MRMTGKVESVRFIEHLSMDLDYCEIVIDFDTLKMFGSYNKIMAYQGKCVEYESAMDIFRGERILRIVNFYDEVVIQTVQETENIKLIPKDASSRVICNFAVSGLKYGDSEVNCIAFLSGYEVGSSIKAKWIDCTLIDKEAKQFSLRIFTTKTENDIDAETVISELIGHYVKFDISNTRYGYQTDFIELVNCEVILPPEVDVAISQIQNVIADDIELQEYMAQYNFVEILKKVIYGELGYHLVAIASEIYMIRAISNISNEYNYKTLLRAAITSRGYLLPAKTKLSRSMLNTNRVFKSSLKNDRELILILDILAEEEISPTKQAYIRIKKFAKQILDERRGLLYEEENYIGTVLAYAKHELGGML